MGLIMGNDVLHALDGGDMAHEVGAQLGGLSEGGLAVFPVGKSPPGGVPEFFYFVFIPTIDIEPKTTRKRSFLMKRTWRRMKNEAGFAHEAHLVQYACAPQPSGNLTQHYGH